MAEQASVSSAAFAAALMQPELPVPEDVTGPNGAPAPKRFGVYRNNVIVSLTEALMATYPALLRLLGEDYFRALARLYVSAEPPSSPVLLAYGGSFSEFIEGFPPLAGYPYLPDVARLEWAWLEAYHAADQAPLEAALLAAVPPEQLGALRFTLHPACRLIVSSFPVMDLVRANRFEIEAGVEVDPGQGQSVLLTRPGIDVVLYPLQAVGDVAFMTALKTGDSLAEAAGSALAVDPAFDLAAAIGLLLRSGAVSEYQIDLA